MESKNNSFLATGESEKIVQNVSTVPVISEEENETSSFNPSLFQTLSFSDPLHTPSTSTTQQLCSNIPATSESDDNLYSPKIELIFENRENFYVTGRSLISPDLLSQTERVLKTLSLDIESSLKNIVKSIAMPAVIETYKKKWDYKTSGVSELCLSTEPSSSQDPQSSSESIQPTPQSNVNTKALPLSYAHCDQMVILQQRCLQYREMIQDIALHALTECGAFTEESVHQIASLTKRFRDLRANFRDFKNLSFNGSFSNSSTQMLTDMVTDVIQSTFLRLLLEETETYIARLDMGLQLGKVCAMVLKMENETQSLISLMEREVLNTRRVSASFKI